MFIFSFVYNLIADRLWWFQLCTEFGNFQVAPKFDAIRSARIDLRYHFLVHIQHFKESPNGNLFSCHFTYIIQYCV